MRKRNIIRLAADNVMSHVLQLGGNIVLAMVLLLLIAVLISVYSMSTNIRHSLQESGIRNIDTLCEIRFWDELDSELQSDPAMDIIKSVDGVEAVTCAWQTGYINIDPALEKLKNIQTGHSFQATDDEDGKDGLYYIKIDATIQNIWKMKLDEGILIEELKPMEDGMYLYLGSAYKDKIEVGTKYIGEVEDKSYTYVVAGILEKGQSFPVSQMEMLDFSDVTGTIPLDYEVLACPGEIFCNNSDFYFSIKQGHSYVKIKRSLMQKLAKAGYKDIKVIDIGKAIENGEEMSRKINYNIIQMLILVGLTFCIVLLCIQILDFLRRRREYGIMLTAGFSMKNITWMILWENILKFLLAYGCSLFLVWWLFIHIIEPDQLMVFSYRSIYWKRVVPILGEISILFVALSTICPVFMIYKCSPIDLLGKEGE